MKKPYQIITASIVTAWLAAAVGLWLHDDTKALLLLKEFATEALIIIFIWAAAWAMGERLKKALAETSEGLEGFLVSGGLGLGAFALFLFVLGVTGLLYQPVVVAATAIPLILSVRRITKIISDIREGKHASEDSGSRAAFSRTETVAILSMFLAGGLVIPLALVPETFYDALYYHDAFPLLFLIRHRMEIFPHAVHSAMPLNIDLLYTIPLSFGGTGMVRMMHISFFAGTCLWVYSLSRRLFGRESALVGTAVWATIPGVGIMAGLGAVDMGVTFFELGAILLLLKAFGNSDNKHIFAKGTLVVSAIFLGLAVGSKYTALMVGAICAVGVIAGAWKAASRRDVSARRALLAVVMYGAISLAVAAPWYIRSWVATGDPLYPALSKSGTPGAVARDNLKKDSLQLYPVSQTFTKLPADLFRAQKSFGVGALLGLGVLAMIPALFWGFWRRGQAAWLATAALAIYLMWSRSILIVRYLYPALALGAMLAGGMLMAEGRGSRWRRALVIAFLIPVTMFDLRAVLTFYESAMGDVLRYVSSPATPAQFLERFVPHSVAAEFVRTLPANSKLLMVGETRGYYFMKNYMPVSGYDRHPLEDWVKEARSPDALRALLKQKGFTNIVLNSSEWQRLNRGYGYLSLDPGGRKIFDDMIGRLNKLYIDGHVEVYAL